MSQLLSVLKTVILAFVFVDMAFAQTIRVKLDSDTPLMRLAKNSLGSEMVLPKGSIIDISESDFKMTFNLTKSNGDARMVQGFHVVSAPGVSEQKIMSLNKLENLYVRQALLAEAIVINENVTPAPKTIVAAPPSVAKPSSQIRVPAQELPATKPVKKNDVKVIYFGGVAANKSVLDKCFPSFKNFGYPSSSSQQQALVDEINRNPNQKYIIAGHSSGAQYANTIASSNIINPSRVTLIDLDGYAPRSVPKDIRRVCWTAFSETQSGLVARNFYSMTQQNNCKAVRKLPDAHCNDNWCLHFSIVNPKTPANLNGRWSSSGYNGCSEANLDWLKEEVANFQEQDPASGLAATSTKKMVH